MNDLRLEKLAEPAIFQLKELFARSGPFVAERTLSDYWLYARLFSDTCFIALQGDILVGAVIAFCDQSKNNKDIYIQDVVVDESFRGIGVGSKLIEAIIKKAKQIGVERLWLTSESDNSQAVVLWKKYGFENKESDYQENGLWVTKDLKGKGRDRVVFSKEII